MSTIDLFSYDISNATFRIIDSCLLDFSPYLPPHNASYSPLLTDLLSSFEPTPVTPQLATDLTLRDALKAAFEKRLKEVWRGQREKLGRSEGPAPLSTTPKDIHIRIRFGKQLYADSFKLSPASLALPGSTLPDIANSLCAQFRLAPSFLPAISHTILTQLRLPKNVAPHLSLQGKHLAVDFEGKKVANPQGNEQPMIVNFADDATKAWQDAIHEHYGQELGGR